MKTLLTICGIMGWLNVSVAQHTIPLLSTGAQNNAAPVTLHTSEKYRNTVAVYQKLVTARGDRRYPVPKLVMTNATADGAKITYDSCEITLEERAYDVCARFGAQRDDALAILLGHELVHYYEKHGWRSGFVQEYQKLNLIIKPDSVQEKITYETQADYLGGFLAYSAGFRLFDKGPALIDSMYKMYGLPNQLPGYPPLQDRKLMSQQTNKKIELLADVFDMANLLTAIGAYSEARVYYEYILKDYQSREMYNNLGVAALLEVLDDDNQPFFFPVELDLRSRAGRGGQAEKRTRLLQLAIQHFDAAIGLDPDYAPGYLNKACAYALLEDYNRAKFYATIEASERALKSGATKTASDVQVLLGIIAHAQGDVEGAKKLFQQEADKKNALAAKNLQVLLKEPETSTGGSFAGGLKAETIDSISLNQFERNLQFEKETVQKLSESMRLMQHNPAGKNSKIYISRNDTPDGLSLKYFHLTKTGYTGKTAAGIALGDNQAAIIQAYKKPIKTIETPTGSLLVYKKLIFILNEEGKLVRWVHYLLP
jgi:tetratricopeptide (TPR) repeat protein